MINTLVQKQKNIIGEVFLQKVNFMPFLGMLAFFLMSTLKITLVNLQMMDNHSTEIILYKFIFTLLVVLIAYPILLMLKSRVVFTVFYVLQTLYMAINLTYYNYFNEYLHVQKALSVFKEGFSATANASAPFTVALLLLLIDLPLFISILVKFNKYATIARKLFIVNMLVLALCVFLISQIEKDNFAKKVSFMQNVKNFYEGQGAIVERYGTLFNMGVNVYQTQQDASNQTQRFDYSSFLASGSDRKDNKPNILIIQVESLDANIVNQMHNGEYVAPYLQSLTNTSVYYPYVLSYHLGGSTSDAEFSILNSLQPLDDYPSMKMQYYEYINSMVRQFDTAYYDTMAFHGNVGGFFNRNKAYPKIGFDKFYDIKAMGLKEIGWGAPDMDVFKYALNTMKETERPFFSYIVTMTSHGPFTNAGNYYNNMNYDDVKEKRVKNYFTSISYVDHSLEYFVKNVQKDLSNTYIVIVGDHTPSIRSKEYTQTAYKDGDRYFEYVPLFIITPNGASYYEKNRVASFLDIAPTLLNASGIEYSIKTDGIDLLHNTTEDKIIPFKDGEFSRELLYDKVILETIGEEENSNQ